MSFEADSTMEFLYREWIRDIPFVVLEYDGKGVESSAIGRQRSPQLVDRGVVGVDSFGRGVEHDHDAIDLVE